MRFGRRPIIYLFVDHRGKGWDRSLSLSPSLFLHSTWTPNFPCVNKWACRELFNYISHATHRTVARTLQGWTVVKEDRPKLQYSLHFICTDLTLCLFPYNILFRFNAFTRVNLFCFIMLFNVSVIMTKVD